MKGFTHFMSGVAVASFGPWAIDAALAGNPIFFILGGACGILPDTLDFKFYRFFYHHDVYVEPTRRTSIPKSWRMKSRGRWPWRTMKIATSISSCPPCGWAPTTGNSIT